MHIKYDIIYICIHNMIKSLNFRILPEVVFHPKINCFLIEFLVIIIRIRNGISR